MILNTLCFFCPEKLSFPDESDRPDDFWQSQNRLKTGHFTQNTGYRSVLEKENRGSWDEEKQRN
ncbi:MAG TPA: hypothetical protein PLJ29_14560 [Leptospiraceae bacterium]|nr:hypothetical protein [Leptospiraceae bacterium]